MYITKSFSSAQDSLSIFRDDPLEHTPGENYLYSTHGFTVVAAVLEAVMAKSKPMKPLFDRPDQLKQPIALVDDDKNLPHGAKTSSLFKELFAFLGLRDTCLDEPYKIVPFSARCFFSTKFSNRAVCFYSRHPFIFWLMDYIGMFFYDPAQAIPS